ncbi:MAG: vitamin K epoxide reductase family protein [Thermoplasmata archaeon]|nr:vitamin K epoxide reductase family protein [Thermoplasmata archaeon]
MRAETLHQVILAAVLAGLGLSFYAGYETVNAAAANSCTFSAVFSCSKVLASGKTTTLGIQDWILGAAGFLALLAVDVPLFRSWDRRLLTVLLGLAAVGLLVSVYLASIEVTQIGALCPVCLSSYAADAIVLVSAWTLFREGRARAAPPVPHPESATADSSP